VRPVDASVLVVGAGAIGGVIAARIAGSVRRVVVLDANDAHVTAMREQGLELEVLGAHHRVQLEAYSEPDHLKGPFDLALLTVKALHLRAAVTAIHERRLVQHYVCLGNGLVHDLAHQLVGADRLLAGTVEWGATNLGPGRVAQTTIAPTVIGELDGSCQDRTRLVAQALGAVGEVQLTCNIAGQIWSKLMVNSTFSGLGAVAGLLYRDVVANPLGRELAYGLWTEGYDVGCAAGVKMPDVLGVPVKALAVRDAETRGPGDAALAVLMRTAGAVKASMLQDIERGNSTEIDFINGAVVAKGAEYGVPTPLNAGVVELIHAAENGTYSPNPAGFASLRHLVRRAG